MNESLPTNFLEVVETLSANIDLDIVQRMRAIGLDPVEAFAGDNWTGCNFSGLDLSGYNLRNASFYACDFRNTNISGAWFEGAVLPKTITKAKGLATAHFDEEQAEQLQLWSEGREATIDWFEKHLERRGDLPATEADYVRWIKLASDFETAGWLVRRMNADGLGPNAFAYATWMNKADPQKARAVLDEFLVMGGEPDGGIYAALIAKMPDYEDALSVFNEMLARGILPNRYAVNKLIDLADFETGKAWVDMIDEKAEEWGFQPDNYSFNPLIEKAPDFAASVKWMDTVVERGLALRKIDFDSAIHNASSYADCRQMLDRMIANRIERDEATYNRVLHHVDDYDTALSVLDEMARLGFDFDRYTLQAISQAFLNQSDMLHFAKLMHVLLANGLDLDDGGLREAFLPIISRQVFHRDLRQRNYFWAEASKLREREDNAGIARLFVEIFFDQGRAREIWSADLPCKAARGAK